MSAGSPRVIGSLPDGSNMWQVGTMYACSWDDAITIPDNSKEKIPRVKCWFESPQAARLAWEIAQKAKPLSRFSKGWTDPRGIFGSKA